MLPDGADDPAVLGPEAGSVRVFLVVAEVVRPGVRPLFRACVDERFPADVVGDDNDAPFLVVVIFKVP
jgi:hypothetical protein